MAIDNDVNPVDILRRMDEIWEDSYSEDYREGDDEIEELYELHVLNPISELFRNYYLGEDSDFEMMTWPLIPPDLIRLVASFIYQSVFL